MPVLPAVIAPIVVQADERAAKGSMAWPMPHKMLVVAALRTKMTRRVSERVRALRSQRQWSARELAEVCAREGMPSLNRSTIAKIESGARKWVTADEIAVLARALGVAPESLMSQGAGPTAGRPQENVPPVFVPDEPERDLPLTQTDIDALMREFARVFNTRDRALALLQSVRFPRGLVPDWDHGSDPLRFWALIFDELGNGAVNAPYRRLLAAARTVYAQNDVFTDLERRYREAVEWPDGTPQAPAPQSAAEAAQACHLVAWIGSDEERSKLEGWLTEQGLEPRLEWSTISSLSYRVTQPDPRVLNRLMRSRPDFPWAVVPPGTPDYVLRFLHAEGPDGQSFRFSDVPSATPVASVADELVGQHTEGMPGAGGQPTVVDHVGAGGPRRMNPDSTLGDEGVTEGDRLRVAFEPRAGGGFNPFYPIAPPNSPFADEDRGGTVSTQPPGMRLAERKPHPFLTVVQLSVANASAVLELHLGYYVCYWRAQIRPDDFIRAIQERDGQSDVALSLVWDSGEVEQRRAAEVIDLAAGRVALLYSRSALIRFTGQDHSWVWQPGPLDVAETPPAGQGTAYVVQASTANHAANFHAASEFLSASAVDGMRLARSTHLLKGYLDRWLGDSRAEGTARG